ncbi:MAG TPA: cupredoxin domain-containing protein [Candidatus Paceibacterota bacterium]
MNKTVLSVIIVVIVLVGGWFLFKQQAPVDSGMPALDTVPTGLDVVDDASNAASTASVGEFKEFKVTGSPFKFSVTEMKVKLGDTVRIVFTNEKGVHDWVVDEFNARTKQLQEGQTETIEFVADKTGTFEYYCSVGTHRAMGMKGNLIVE